MKQSLILGHRGARLTAPENSIDSFKNAVECGADGIELDVHLAKDGKLVVIHDADLRRITGEKVPIRDLTLSQIKSLDISRLIKKSSSFRVFWNIKVIRFSDNKFSVIITDKETGNEWKYFVETNGASVKSVRKARFRKKYQGSVVAEKQLLFEQKMPARVSEPVRIPELSEVLEKVKPRFINIEIKRGEGFYPGISDAVVRSIEPFGFDNILISSFNRETLLHIKKIYPFIKVNYLYEIPKNPVKAAKNFDGVNPLSVLIGKKGIERVHRIGKTVYPWVVNKPFSIAKFVLFGADGIITDRPCFAVKLKNIMEELFDEAVK